MTRKAAKTGPGAMVLVAIEQGFAEEERIITDPLAYSLLPLGSRVWVRLTAPVREWVVRKAEKKVPGLWGGILARKRYIDDAVAGAVGSHVDAIVNLGAGFDTRSFRLRELAATPIWEIDQPGSVEAKGRRLQSILGAVPSHVTLVPIDFDKEDLESVLASHGYLAGRSTFFIWEGVTQYLSEPAVRKTLEYLSKAPAGSRLVFTYCPQDFIDGRVLYGQEFLYRRMRGKDAIWRTGLDPGTVDDLLAEYGWGVREHIGYDELHERYVKPTGRDLLWMGIERIVDAERL